MSDAPPAGAAAHEEQLASERLAYHGPVRLASWAESSSQDFKLKVELLDGREALEHFEKATRRTKKRAGQRYRAVWQSEAGEAVEGAPQELFFCGADWSHQNGATVKFALHPDDVAWVKAQRTVDVDALVERYFLGLVQLDTDDKPVNQAQAAIVEWTENLVGGPKSKAAARRCQEPEFQVFVAQRLGLKAPATKEQADRWIKSQCGIHSKKLLDHVTETWERYERRVTSPYITWTQSRGARTAPATVLGEREPGSDDA
jgi:hypothetical protein